MRWPSGEICFVVGWSGDVMQARSRAAEAKNDIEIGYAIPKEGAQMFFDNLAIPADAKNVAEAYELINYLYRPDVAAKNSDFLSYANGNLASQKLIDPKILNDKNIYPDEAIQKKLFVINARDPATQRIINRLWTRVKTGKVDLSPAAVQPQPLVRIFAHPAFDHRSDRLHRALDIDLA